MRFLCLHGMGTSSQIFEAQLSRIKDQLEGHHDFVFLQGEVETDPAPGIKEFYPGPYYTYFEVPTKCQVQEALELLEEFIEDEGPFDGVIAFSNGAAVAASYLLQDSKRPSPQHPFKCAVFFVPLCPSILTPYLLRVRSTAPITSSVAQSQYHHDRFSPACRSCRATGFAQKNGIGKHRYFGDMVHSRIISQEVLGSQARISLQQTTSPIGNSQCCLRSCFRHRIERW